MNKPRSAIARSLLPGLLALSFFGACSAPRKHGASDPHDHAFIAYWPPPENSKGLRLAVKDNIDVKGVVTSAGSEYLARTNPPAVRDAKCLEIARARNVQIVGKTNATEFGITVSGINDYFGTPKNRLSWRRWLIPGGSSSGSAVAVATGRADISFGTDTAGSVRVPAACCGIVGLKTTFGLVPLDGVYPIEPYHLDTVGPLARDIPHLVQGMDLLQRGFAARYQAATAARPSARGIKIGRLRLDGTDPEIERAIDRALAVAGFQVIALDPAFKAKWKQADKDAKVVALGGIWLTDHQYQTTSGVSVRTKAVITLGRVEYPKNYTDALKRQGVWQRSLREVFKKVDFIALPTLQALPPDVPLFGASPLFEAKVLALQNTAAVNFAGNPALAAPIPLHERGIPFTSVQLVGPPLSEAKLLNAGRFINAGRP